MQLEKEIEIYKKSSEDAEVLLIESNKKAAQFQDEADRSVLELESTTRKLKDLEEKYSISTEENSSLSSKCQTLTTELVSFSVIIDECFLLVYT